MSRSLVNAYISGLQLTSIAVVGAGRQCRIQTGEPAPGEVVQLHYYFKPSHADLVLSMIGQEGLSGRPAAALAELVVQTATKLGAPCQTPGALRVAAGGQVEEIIARIKDAGQQGKLKTWNSRYRTYRLAQAAAGEKAIPYSAYIEQVVIAPTVRDVAARAG